MTTNETTDRPRQPRLHDLRSLKQRIKDLAADTRSQRDEARALTGMDKHYAKEGAKENASEVRSLGLAYGYLRGRRIEQMESLYTRLENLPDDGDIRYYAYDYFMKGPDAEPWEKETRTEVQIPVKEAAPDDRGVIGRLLGRPAPEPKVRYEIKTKVEQNDPPGWDEFAVMIADDIKAWKAKVTIAHAVPRPRVARPDKQAVA